MRPPPTSAPAPQPAPAVPVRCGKATREDWRLKLSAIGWVESYATVVIKPQVSGELREIHFREGQDLAAGEPLFTIDPRNFEAALRLAEANLKRDRAMATDAEAEADRLAGLFERGQANDRERDQSRATADAQHAQVAAREAEVELARLDLEHCRIKSPIDGRAGSYKVNVGNVVKLNDTELLTMNQIAPIYVTFSVPEQYLAEIRRMQASEKLPVEAHPGDSDESPQPGRLVFLDNQIDRSTGMVRLKALFDNADGRLWPGRFVRVNLSLTAIADALVVPDTAVQPGATGPIVFVVDESDKCSVREVVTGPTQGGQTVIAGGLVGGEIVVTDGQLRLTPGAVVSIQNSPTSAPAAASAPGLAVENNAARPAAAEAKR